jgi:hypothetical protein
MSSETRSTHLEPITPDNAVALIVDTGSRADKTAMDVVSWPLRVRAVNGSQL